jgi:hypothetical protein
VKASSSDGYGLEASSETAEAIYAHTRSDRLPAVLAINDNTTGSGYALWAQKHGAYGGAGYFLGDVDIVGSLTVKGVTFQSLIERIQELEQILHTGHGGTTQPADTGQPATIVLDIEPIVPGSEHKQLRIKGDYFEPGEQVDVTIIRHFQGSNETTPMGPYADPKGSFEASEGGGGVGNLNGNVWTGNAFHTIEPCLPPQ